LGDFVDEILLIEEPLTILMVMWRKDAGNVME
jgi:hypothetical protein